MKLSPKQLRSTILIGAIAFTLSGCQSVTVVGSPELADKYLKPVDGVFALVINKDGDFVIVDREGKVAQRCQSSESSDTKLPLCAKTINTTIKSVSTITLIEHTGSKCKLITYPDGNGHTIWYDPCTGKSGVY
jgi:hypothetical protein